MGFTAAIIGGLAAAGSTAYAASQTPDAPDPISYAQEYAQILKTQLNNAGKLYSAHAQWDPKYGQLDEQLLIQRLLGGPGGTRQEQYTEYVMGPPQYTIEKVSDGHGYFREKKVEIPGSRQPVPVIKTRTVSDAPTRGLLDIVSNDVQPVVRDMQQADERARIAGEIATMQQYGGASVEAMKAANPGAAALIDELTRQAQGDLAAGGTLTPDLRREITQAVRQGQADRGGGFSPADVFAEAMQTASASEALKTTRRNFAANVAQMNQGFLGDTYMKMFGRSSGATPSAGTFLSQPGGRTASFNPESPMAQDITGANFNAQQSAYQAGQNNLNSVIGANVGNIGNLLSSYIRSTSNPGLSTSPGRPTMYNPSAGQSGLQLRGLGY